MAAASPSAIASYRAPGHGIQARGADLGDLGERPARRPGDAHDVLPEQPGIDPVADGFDHAGRLEARA